MIIWSKIQKIVLSFRFTEFSVNKNESSWPTDRITKDMEAGYDNWMNLGDIAYDALVNRRDKSWYKQICRVRYVKLTTSAHGTWPKKKFCNKIADRV